VAQDRRSSVEALETTKNMPDDKNEQPKKRRATERQREAGLRNLLAFNASRSGRPRLSHGVASTVSNGEIPAEIPDAKEVTESVDRLISALVSDLGGEEALTGGKRVILAGERLALLIIELSARRIIQDGVLNGNRPHPLLNILGTYINSARLGAKELGLERIPRNVMPTLDVALAQLAAKETHGSE
jgi:hypothetical protein